MNRSIPGPPATPACFASGRLITVVLWLVFLPAALTAQNTSAAAAGSDALLQAMQIEMQRSKSQLKLENMPAPYFIDYRVIDTDEYKAEAAFGAVRSSARTRFRFLRVV